MTDPLREAAQAVRDYIRDNGLSVGDKVSPDLANLMDSLCDEVESLVGTKENHVESYPAAPLVGVDADGSHDCPSDPCPTCAALEALPYRVLPRRVVVDDRGFYWRDYGAFYSMCPVSEDNDPLTVAAVYAPAPAAPLDLRAECDLLADALAARFIEHGDPEAMSVSSILRHYATMLAAAT